MKYPYKEGSLEEKIYIELMRNETKNRTYGQAVDAMVRLFNKLNPSSPPPSKKENEV